MTASENLIFDNFAQKPCQAFYSLFSYLFYAAFGNGESLLLFKTYVLCFSIKFASGGDNRNFNDCDMSTRRPFI